VKPTCFVVQGFGKKTDYATGRVLDLDASYAVIKEAVEAADLQCIRADEIVHSGTIDVPMYTWLLRADVVIADLSTSNVNAAYELGVRYALRPRTTIILAESGFKSPFDVNHVVIRPYKHLGDDVGAQEAKRLKSELSAALKELLAGGAVDSPVYTYLALRPPVEGDGHPAVVAAAVAAAAPAAPAPSAPAPTGAPVVADDDGNTRQLLERARAATDASDFDTARVLFQLIREQRPSDDYVVQQLALATYKSKRPDARQALADAREILKTLKPEKTTDPETLGLWGAVHKRMWDLDGDRVALDVAIGAHERGFYLKQDYYNGINLAFMLNQRADLARRAGDLPNAIADFVVAQRVRRDVVAICERARAAGNLKPDEQYWVAATLWEAAIGIDDAAAAINWEAEARRLSSKAWMIGSTEDQLKRLRELIAASPLRT
jgi:tetratricopeptide (TPR) repeat protein